MQYHMLYVESRKSLRGRTEKNYLFTECQTKTLGKLSSLPSVRKKNTRQRTGLPSVRKNTRQTYLFAGCFLFQTFLFAECFPCNTRQIGCLPSARITRQTFQNSATRGFPVVPSPSTRTTTVIKESLALARLIRLYGAI